MSGHSKWSKIKRQKKAADVKKGQLFTKLGQAITNAVREGHGADPDINFLLRMAIDQAKDANMPKDTIQRAIDKGLGKGDQGELKPLTLEVVGKDGVGILVDCHTDNKKRTMLQVKNAIADSGFEIGTGIAWQFESRGKIVLESKIEKKVEVKGKEKTKYEDIDKDTLLLEIMELVGVIDIKDEKEIVTIYTQRDRFNEILTFCENKKLKVNEASMIKFVKNNVEVNDEQYEVIKDVRDTLSDLEDVDAVWVNVRQ